MGTVRSVRSAIGAVVAVVVVATGLVATAVPATAEPVPVTAVSTRYLGDSVSDATGLDPAEAWVSPDVTVDASRGVVVIGIPSEPLTLHIWAAGGLAVGTFPLTGPTGTGSGTVSVEVSIPRDAITPSMYDGSVVVHALTTDDSGILTSLAADVVGNLRDDRRRFEIRWNSTVPFAGVSATPDLGPGGTYAATPTGATPMTLVNRGPFPVTPGPAVVEGIPTEDGDGSPAFTVLSDGCAGRVLSSGASCSVTVRALARDPGAFYARLRVPLGEGDFLVGSLYLNAVRDGQGSFHAVAPRRLLDTRVTGGALGPGALRRLHLAGRTGLPATYEDLLLNVTAVSPSADTSLTILREKDYIAKTSFLDLSRGETRAAPVTTYPNPAGDVYIRNAWGSTHVVVDVVGWFEVVEDPASEPGGILQPVRPTRVADTRNDGRPLAPGGTLDLFVGLQGRHVTPNAVLVNLTAVAPSRGGHLVAWNGAGSAPTTSVVNFRASTTTANLAVVPVQPLADGMSFSIRNGSTGATHVLVDVLGWFDTGIHSGVRFDGLTDQRVLDSRSGVGGPASPMVSGATARVDPRPSVGEEAVGAWLTVKAVRPTRTGHLTAWSGLGGEPGVSTVNSVAGQVTSNAAVTGLSAGRLSVTNHSGRSDLVVDRSAVWRLTPLVTSPTDLPADLAAHRAGARRFDIGVTPNARVTRR